jgi:hypothetical protein
VSLWQLDASVDQLARELRANTAAQRRNAEAVECLAIVVKDLVSSVNRVVEALEKLTGTPTVRPTVAKWTMGTRQPE